eukprot:IDg2353t1
MMKSVQKLRGEQASAVYTHIILALLRAAARQPAERISSVFDLPSEIVSNYSATITDINQPSGKHATRKEYLEKEVCDRSSNNNAQLWRTVHCAL